MKFVKNIVLSILFSVMITLPLVKIFIGTGYWFVGFLFFTANLIGFTFELKVNRFLAVLAYNIIVIAALYLTIGSAAHLYLVRNFPILNDVLPQIIQGKDLSTAISLSPAAIAAKSTIFQYQQKKEEDLDKEVAQLLAENKLDEAIARTNDMVVQHKKVIEMINPPKPVKQDKPVAKKKEPINNEVITLSKKMKLPYDLGPNEASPWILAPTGVLFSIETPPNTPFRVYFWDGDEVNVSGANMGLPKKTPAKFMVVNPNNREIQVEITGL